MTGAAVRTRPMFAPVPSSDGQRDAVAALIRSVARRAVMPRFRNLLRGDVVEKSPGELVTIADREAEELLAEGLLKLAPGTRIVGEEACSDDPALMDDLGRGAIWIVDPIDGTANFAAGQAPFGMMIARAQDGVVEQAWLYDPLRDRLCQATRGKGAFIDGARFRAAPVERARPVAALATQFMDEAERDTLRMRAARALDLVPIPRCAAEHYPRLARGENDIALFQRTLPWDHAAGGLFLSEAGGHVAHWDGAEYRIDNGRSGLLAATSAALWEKGAQALFGADHPI
jgi:fructose-1,6-bisphosphatase/inositol monophosphatase family enzyme